MTTESNLAALHDIRKMMERSSRFISLSGWSGVFAGLSALVGAVLAKQRVDFYYHQQYNIHETCPSCLMTDLTVIAVGVFIVAIFSAIFFTYLRGRREHVKVWGIAARRLMWNTTLPMVAGGIFIWHLIELKVYGLVPSASLIFYGLALINGSKFTMGEVRYLGYAELALGLISCWTPHSWDIYCWGLGFGVLHIVYGIAMWWKYERRTTRTTMENATA